MERDADFDIPIAITFDQYDYQNLDQAEQSKQMVGEVQRILGCLSLAALGDCSIDLFSSNQERVIRISDELVTLHSPLIDDLKRAKAILDRYSVAVD